MYADHRHVGVLSIQRYLDPHNIARTKRAIEDLVARNLNP